MNVVDSSGWLEYFADSANADFIAAAIEDEANLVVPAITVYEVFKRVLSQRGEESALSAAANMLRGYVIELDAALAIEAAQLSVQYKLPMADSIIFATAQRADAVLLTQDSDMASLPGVTYTPKT